jgi:hypothetical protein
MYVKSVGNIIQMLIDLISLSCRLVASFDDFYNLANPEFEEYKVSYTSVKDGAILKDVAVSYSIIQKVAVHSIYFFSSSDGLLLTITHNGTRVPPSNFIRRSMQVDQFLEVLEKSGFNSLFADQTVANPRAAPTTTTIRSLEPTNSSDSVSTVCNDLTPLFLTPCSGNYRMLPPFGTPDALPRFD